MKKKIVSVVSMVLLLCMVFSTNLYASEFARETITLGKNQTWNIRQVVPRTMKYSVAYTRCYAVYPLDGGSDTFTKIKAQLRTSDKSTVISNTITLYETFTDITPITIKEGYLNSSSIRFAFSGNNPDYAANADVYYYGN